MKLKKILVFTLVMVTLFTGIAEGRITDLDLQITNQKDLGDYMGEVMIGNTGWIALANEERRHESIVIAVSWLNHDSINMTFYSQRLEDDHQSMGSLGEPNKVTEQQFADGYRRAIINDLDENEYRDDLVFSIRIYSDWAREFKNEELTLKLYKGDGKWVESERFRKTEPTHNLHYIDGIMETIESEEIAYRGVYEEYYAYIPMDEAINVFRGLQEIQNKEPTHYYLDIDFYGEQKNRHGHYRDFKGEGLVKMPISDIPDELKRTREQVFERLDYFQDIGRLRQDIEHEGIGKNVTTDRDYIFDPNLPVVYPEKYVRDINLNDLEWYYDKMDNRMKENDNSNYVQRK